MRGLGSFILYKKESSFATKPSGNYDIGYIKSGARSNMQPAMTPINYLSSSRSVGKIGNNPSHKTIRQVQGSLNFDLSSSLKPLMQLAFYDENSSSHTGGEQLHFDSSNNHSFTLEHQIGSLSNKRYEQTGCFITSYGFNVPSLDSLVQFNVDMIGKKEEYITSGLASTSSNLKPFNPLFPSYLAKLELRDNGSLEEVLEYSSLSINVNNNVQYQNYLSSTVYNEQKPTIGLREIIGTATLRLKENKLQWFENIVTNKDEKELNLVLTDEEENTMTINLASVYFQTGHLNNIVEGELSISTGFISLKNSSHDIKVTY